MDVEAGELRELVFEHGIPDQLRPQLWSILLANQAKKLRDYQELMGCVCLQNRPLAIINSDVTRTQSNLTFFTNPIQIQSDSKILDQLVSLSSSHSLANSQTSTAKDSHQLFQDPTITFSPHPAPTPLLSLQAPSPVSSPSCFNLASNQTGDHTPNTTPPSSPRQTYTYRHLLTRLLYVWASLNPGVGYVQGMNELGAVLLYVYAQSSSHSAKLDPQDVEADAFWAFTALMSTFRDLFISALDDMHQPITRSFTQAALITKKHPQAGIGKLLARYTTLLQQLDPALSTHLSILGLDPNMYAFNWFICLFTHSFDLADVIRLWDPLLAITEGEERLDFLVDLACAFTLQLSPALMAHTSFSGAIQVLQARCQPAHITVDQVVRDALVLRMRRRPQGPGVHDPALGDESKRGDRRVYEDSRQQQGPLWSSLQRYTTNKSSTPVPSGHHQEAAGGLLGKLKNRAEAWKDSDTAAAISKQATNWTILASSWRPPTLVSKLNALSLSSSSPAPPVRRHSFCSEEQLLPQADDDLRATMRWSRVSSSSSSTAASASASLTDTFASAYYTLTSPSSSTFGSPVAAAGSASLGPKPLLLSSRARTAVSVQAHGQQTPQGIIDGLASSWKRIGTPQHRPPGLSSQSPCNSPSPKGRAYAHNQRPSLADPFHSPIVNILGRSRSPPDVSPSSDFSLATAVGDGISGGRGRETLRGRRGRFSLPHQSPCHQVTFGPHHSLS